MTAVMHTALVCVLLLVHQFAFTASAPSYIRVWSSVELWTSRLEQQPSLRIQPVSRLSHAHNTLSVDPSKRYQRIVGFGGAITEASTSTLALLSPSQQAAVLEAYYGPTGHRYTLGRVPINSCDFSLDSYNYDDVPDDFRLTHFDNKLQRDNRTLIPFLQAALAASTPSSASSASSASPRLRLFASPWSPPGWMKANGAMTGSSSPCLKADDRYHQAWADYYVKWLQSMRNEYDIDYFAITVQNEPEFAAPWEACTWTPAEQKAFVVDFLSPTLRRHGLERVKVLVYDHNKDHVVKWSKEILADEQAAELVWGIAVHWYSGDAFDELEAAHDVSPNHHILATEACNCPGVQLNDWGRAERYAHDIIGDLNHWAVGWTDWNIALDERGGPNHLGNLCDAQMIVRTDYHPPSVHYQPTYYVFGHFSRFLPPGAVRVAHSLTSIHPVRHVGHIGGQVGQDAGAGSGVSEQQSANIASENARIEVTTWLDEEKSELIIVLFNPSDTDEQLKVMGQGKDEGAIVFVPAHSLHTLVMDAE